MPVDADKRKTLGHVLFNYEGELSQMAGLLVRDMQSCADTQGDTILIATHQTADEGLSLILRGISKLRIAASSLQGR